MKVFFYMVGLFFCCQVFGQTSLKVTLKPFEIEGMPAIHSFAYAQSGDKYILIGGRIGVPISQLNYSIFVIDPTTNSIWEKSLESLNIKINCQEHLASSHAAYTQVGNFLYLAGGLGFVEDREGFGNFPYLTRIDIKELISVIIENKESEGVFLQIENNEFRNMGGSLLYLDSLFYLVGGKKTEGSFNENGKLQIEERSMESFLEFTLMESDNSISIDRIEHNSYGENFNSSKLKVLTQVYPGDQNGFQLIQNNVLTKKINQQTYSYQSSTILNESPLKNIPYFHSTIVPFFMEDDQSMHSIIMGGCVDYLCSQEEFYSNNLIGESQHVKRDIDGYLTIEYLYFEEVLMEGRDAVFMSLANPTGSVRRLDKLNYEEKLIGYIVGGSLAPSPMFFEDGSVLDGASNQLFKVFLSKERKSNFIEK